MALHSWPVVFYLLYASIPSTFGSRPTRHQNDAAMDWIRGHHWYRLSAKTSPHQDRARKPSAVDVDELIARFENKGVGETVGVDTSLSLHSSVQSSNETKEEMRGLLSARIAAENRGSNAYIKLFYPPVAKIRETSEVDKHSMTSDGRRTGQQELTRVKRQSNRMPVKKIRRTRRLSIGISRDPNTSSPRLNKYKDSLGCLENALRTVLGPSVSIDYGNVNTGLTVAQLIGGSTFNEIKKRVFSCAKEGLGDTFYENSVEDVRRLSPTLQNVVLSRTRPASVLVRPSRFKAFDNSFEHKLPSTVAAGWVDERGLGSHRSSSSFNAAIWGKPLRRLWDHSSTFSEAEQRRLLRRLWSPSSAFIREGQGWPLTRLWNSPSAFIKELQDRSLSRIWNPSSAFSKTTQGRPLYHPQTPNGFSFPYNASSLRDKIKIMTDVPSDLGSTGQGMVSKGSMIRDADQESKLQAQLFPATVGGRLTRTPTVSLPNVRTTFRDESVRDIKDKGEWFPWSDGDLWRTYLRAAYKSAV